SAGLRASLSRLPSSSAKACLVASETRVGNPGRTTSRSSRPLGFASRRLKTINADLSTEVLILPMPGPIAMKDPRYGVTQDRVTVGGKAFAAIRRGDSHLPPGRLIGSR